MKTWRASPWRGPKTKRTEDGKASPGRNCRPVRTYPPAASRTHRAAQLANSPETCAPPSRDRWRVAHAMSSETAPQDARTPREACGTPAPSSTPTRQARFFNARPYTTYATEPRPRARTRRTSAPPPPPPPRRARHSRRSQRRGRFGVEVGGKHHGTYVRTARHGARRDAPRFSAWLPSSIPPPNAAGRWELLRRKRSGRQSARHGTHLSTPAGGRAGRRRCRRAFHPLVGAVRRRSRSRNGPRFAVPTCGGGRRASLLRNRSKWWTLVEPD